MACVCFEAQRTRGAGPLRVGQHTAVQYYVMLHVCMFPRLSGFVKQAAAFVGEAASKYKPNKPN